MTWSPIVDLYGVMTL